MIRRMLIHTLLAALLVTAAGGAVQAFASGHGPIAVSEGGRDADD